MIPTEPIAEPAAIESALIEPALAIRGLVKCFDRPAVDGLDLLADPVAAKSCVAWISDEPMIYDKLTPLEYLEFVAGLWGIEARTAQARAHELIGWLGLGTQANQRCEGFSKGTRQK